MSFFRISEANRACVGCFFNFFGWRRLTIDYVLEIVCPFQFVYHLRLVGLRVKTTGFDFWSSKFDQ